MAYALCSACGKEVHWEARRGRRLSDCRCPCGGGLRGKTAGRGGGNAGRKRVSCAVCGRGRFSGSGSVLQVPFSFDCVLVKPVPSDPPRWETTLGPAYPRGSWVCWTHRIHPAELVVVPGEGPRWFVGDLVAGPPRYYDEYAAAWVRAGAAPAVRP